MHPQHYNYTAMIIVSAIDPHRRMQEKARLAKAMPPRKITTCQDEMFHPEPCLVALAPVSNFILLERYAPTRTAAAWQAAMAEALKDLPVQVGAGVCPTRTTRH